MLFRICFIQSCWVFWGRAVRRDLENARRWSSIPLSNLTYNILAFWFWPKGWRKSQWNCVPLLQLKFTQRPTLHIVCGKYFQSGDRAKERFFSDLESSVMYFILCSHVVNWCHILYVLSCDFCNTCVGQTGKARTFRDKARLSAGVCYCASLGKQLILSCILGITLQKGLMGLNGKSKRQRNFTWAVETLACMEDITELMDQPDPREANIFLTPCGIICLQSDPQSFEIDTRLPSVLHSANKFVHRADIF